MKTLSLTFLALVLIITSCATQQGKTTDELLTKVRAELPQGWTTSYDKAHLWLEISRVDSVQSASARPNSPPFQKPELREFSFAFRIMPLISPVEHRRLTTENMKIQKDMTALYEELIKMRVPHKFDSFSPKTDSEKADVARYEVLKKSLHTLPDFYFRDISLKWQIDSPAMPVIFIEDQLVRDECTRVREGVVKLLSKYDAN